jgi:hypothetical protein
LREPSPTPEDADSEEVLMGYPNISRAPFANLLLSRGFAWHASRVWLREHKHLNTWHSQV